MFFTDIQMDVLLNTVEDMLECIVGLVFLGVLIFSLKQYIEDKDFIGIIICSVLSCGFILAGILVKRWARKKGGK